MVVYTEEKRGETLHETIGIMNRYKQDSLLNGMY